VRESARRQATCGIAFHGRGYDMIIGPPVGRQWTDIPREVLTACADACPTGALTHFAETSA